MGTLELSWPQITTTPPTVGEVDLDRGRMTFTMRWRIDSLAGLVPLVTTPGHEATLAVEVCR